MALQAGSKLGPYEILSLIGVGGMGEVYRAKDLRLDRTVAIKTLPLHFSADPDRKKRFEREARTISSLSHAHICALYDIGDYGGTDYLVMEYLEGDSLADRLQKSQLTIEFILRYSIQIAEALDKAHRQGIVHRDLKPGNIMLTKSGAKLLDFGLAKFEESIVDGTKSQLMTRDKPLTEEGVVLGTVQYMAPEQLEGKQTDARTDIFALGEVMYEMATGQKAFSGASKASLISSILTSDPKAISAIQPLAPPALDHVVKKCLAKDPDERWQSAHDVASELKWIAEGGSQTGPMSAVATVKVKPRDSKIAWSVAAIATLLLIATLGFTFWKLRRIEPQVNWSGMRLGGPEIAMDPRISPDGRTLAFQAMIANNTQVAVMKPETGDWQVLTHRSDSGYVENIAWSSDGNRIYFDRGADVPMGVFSVPVFGGAEQLVVEDAQMPQPLPDGSLLLVKLNANGELQLFRFWPDSGRFKPFPLTLPDALMQMRLFPDGKEAVAVGRLIGSSDQANHLFAVNIDSGEVRRVPTDLREDQISAIATTPDDGSFLISIRSEDLTRIAKVPRNGGAYSYLPLTFTEAGLFLDVANDGSVYTDAQGARGVIAQLPVEGGASLRIGTLLMQSLDSMLPLPDGRIVVAQYLAGRSRLVAVEVGKDPASIITTNEETRMPVTMISDSEIAFLIGPQSGQTIAVASLKTGRVTRRINFDKGIIYSLAASPDGETIYCAAAGTIWRIPQSGQPQKICAGQSVAADPDGKSLIIKILQAPKAKLLRVPLDGSASREIPLNGPFHLTFDPVISAGISRDGRMLAPLASLDDWFFVPGIIDLTTGRMSRITTDQMGDYHAMCWLPNGNAAARTNEMRSTIWKFSPKQ